MKFRTKVLTSTLAILLLVGGLYLWQGQGLFNFGTPESESETVVDEEALQREIDEQKERQEEQAQQNEQNNQTDHQNKQNATVVIADAGLYDGVVEVRSFIPDFYQDGTCTITFRKGGQSVIKEMPAFRDATTTICSNPNVPRAEFPSGGEWTVSVLYESADARGQSETVTINLN